MFDSHEAVRQFKNRRKKETKKASNSIKSKILNFFATKSNCEIALHGKKELPNEFDVLHMYQQYEYPIKEDLLESVREKNQLILQISYEDDRGFYSDKEIFIHYNLIEKN